MSDHLSSALSLITGIKQKSRDVAQDTHLALCHSIMHAIGKGSGDVSLCTQIIGALGKGHDRNLVIGWLKEFGCAKWDRETNQFMLNKGKFNGLKAARVTFDELVALTPWYEFGKDVDQLARPFDLLKAIEGVVKSYDNAKDKGKVIQHAEFLGEIVLLRDRLIANAANDAKDKAEVQAA
jgi:hypothetical protein